jgi:SNF2 family DNA or RNA helicase
MRAFAELNDDQDRIDVRFQYDPATKDAVKAIGGARFVPKDKGGPLWRLPLDLTVGRRLRDIFGDELELGIGLKAWGKDARDQERNLGAMSRADDWPLEKMRLAVSHPELAKYLRPYQRADIAMQATTNVANGNQMGLGKTVEVIASWIEAELLNGQHLVVAPKTSLDGVWREEITTWLPGMPVFSWSGDVSKARREEMAAEMRRLIAAGSPFVLVCTPTGVRDTLPRDIAEIEWASITIDEFHKAGLTNASGDPTKGSKFAQVMRKIKADRKYALSGTPIGGKPIKLWGVLHWLHPEKFTSKWRWAEEWLEVTDNGFGKDIGGLKPEKEDEFYSTHAQYMIRRLKREVLPQLPPKIYEDVWVEMSPGQRKAYDKFAADAEIRIEEERLSANGVLAEYARLKQFANAKCRLERANNGQLLVIPTDDAPKVDALWDKLDEQGIRPGEDAVKGELALVGSESERMVTMVAAELRKRGLYVEVITGKVKQDERTRIQKICRDPETRPQVIVMTTTAGGMSINLQEANSVHILDETWNPDDQLQLEDRADRGSRETPLMVIYYRSRDTVQEGIWRLTQGKQKVNLKLLDELRQEYRAGAVA